MKIAASPFGRYLRAALMLLLLAAQGVAAAHELNHWHGPSQEICATCSIGNGLDSPLAAPQTPLQTPDRSAFVYTHAVWTIHWEVPRNFFQRAPPFHL